MTNRSVPTLLEVKDLYKTFAAGGREVHAVRGVSFTVASGEMVALVGESGSGKSTVARMIMRLISATSGTVSFEGEDLLKLSGEQLRQARRNLQMVFQDPMASLNPRMSIARILTEPLAVHRTVPSSEFKSRAATLLESVGLPADFSRRYPHELSGGQRQRVGIARALALEPRLIIADEPVSALDVSVRAQIVNLLRDLQQSRGLSYLFIAHDLALVRQIAHRVAVMYAGRIMEIATAAQLFEDARHPYTRRLLSAIPSLRHPGKLSQRSTQPIILPDVFTMEEVTAGHWVAAQ